MTPSSRKRRRECHTSRHFDVIVHSISERDGNPQNSQINLSQTTETWVTTYDENPRTAWLDMTQCEDTVYKGQKYHVQDFVYVHNDKSIKQQNDVGTLDCWIAMILEIRVPKENRAPYARIYWMYLPEDLPENTQYGQRTIQGRQEFYEKNELVASNHMDIIDMESIAKKAAVSTGSNGNRVPTDLFWRQIFSPYTMQLFDMICSSMPRAHPKWRQSKSMNITPTQAQRKLAAAKQTLSNADTIVGEECPLVFPSIGRTGNIKTIVYGRDVTTLDAGQCLNNNPINFYLEYLQLESGKPEPRNKMYIFNTFFFKNLRGLGKYDSVRNWTAKFDLFSFDYVAVPIHENAHWYLAIICNLSNAVNGMSAEERRLEGKDRRIAPTIDGHMAKGFMKKSPDFDSGVHIITLDSLGTIREASCKVLREYLVAEAQDKKQVRLAITPTEMNAKHILQQDEYFDCGVDLLGYMKQFLKNPDEVARKLFLKQQLDWDIRPSELRNKIREILLELHEDGTGRLGKEKLQSSLNARAPSRYAFRFVRAQTDQGRTHMKRRRRVL